MKKEKGKISTILIVIATIILAGVAIFTATRLYNLRDQAVAPNVPTSRPAAQVVDSCSLSFTISEPTATSTASGSPTSTATATATSTSTATSTATATASPNPQCNYSCTSNSDCPSDLTCYIPSSSSSGNCRNTQCLAEADCTCPQASIATPTSTSTSVAQSQPTSTPELPDAGTSWPTILGGGLGILIIFGALLLAL